MDITDKVIMIFIVAALIPAAITTLNQTNTEGWTAPEIALWALIGILVIVGIVKQFVQ